MKKALKEAKEPLFVSLYFIVTYCLSCWLTLLTGWNFGLFLFGIFFISLAIFPSLMKQRAPERIHNKR